MTSSHDVLDKRVPKPEDISVLAQRGALALEIQGMRRHGRSVYSIVKEQYGFKGSKSSVLKQLEDHIEKNIVTLNSRYTARG